ncbi:low temperature requirement protein A [Paenibacillus agricola]|uniref:Low temperature requirement protein A n=1 Tax=Paenibacillus agricola TaxID=2716264 RepID=A0ABX0IWK3_9BACL|nr:low temperature requirement protein A [Paenibacillus agricola]NHN28282.1 low temperature requirement protein A [Paenibacillus agricola]
MQIGMNKKVTWLELFYDLIYVVAIAATTHVLAHSHHGTIPWDIVVKYLLIFIPVWWAWVGFTMYVNRYGEECIPQRIIYFVQMVFVIILTASINTDFESYYLTFMLSYVGIRLSIVFMYTRLWMRSPRHAPIQKYLSIGFFIGAMISLNSIWITGNWKFVLLFAGIGFDMLLPIVAHKLFMKHPIHNHHLSERFGLVTLIVLGESIVSIIDTIRVTPFSLPMAVAALCGFLITVFVWWHYFETSERVIDPNRVNAGHAILYMHLFIFISLGILANVIRYGINLELALDSYKALATVGVATYALSTYFLFHYQSHKKHQKGIAWFMAYLVFLMMFSFFLWLMPTVVSVMIVMTLFIGGFSLFLVHHVKQSHKDTHKELHIEMNNELQKD